MYLASPFGLKDTPAVFDIHCNGTHP